MGLNKCKSYDDSDYICQQCSINHMEIHNSCYIPAPNVFTHIREVRRYCEEHPKCEGCEITTWCMYGRNSTPHVWEI